jgi:hypothetical protein
MKPLIMHIVQPPVTSTLVQYSPQHPVLKYPQSNGSRVKWGVTMPHSKNVSKLQNAAFLLVGLKSHRSWAEIRLASSTNVRTLCYCREFGGDCQGNLCKKGHVRPINLMFYCAYCTSSYLIFYCTNCCSSLKYRYRKLLPPHSF